MRKRIYFGKFDKWLSEKPLEESWTGVVVTLCIHIPVYLLMYFDPEITFYINGYVTPPRRHMFTMMWFSGLFLIILFFTLLKIIRLLRKKK